MENQENRIQELIVQYEKAIRDNAETKEIIDEIKKCGYQDYANHVLSTSSAINAKIAVDVGLDGFTSAIVDFFQWNQAAYRNDIISKLLEWFESDMEYLFAVGEILAKDIIYINGNTTTNNTKAIIWGKLNCDKDYVECNRNLLSNFIKYIFCHFDNNSLKVFLPKMYYMAYMGFDNKEFIDFLAKKDSENFKNIINEYEYIYRRISSSLNYIHKNINSEVADDVLLNINKTNKVLITSNQSFINLGDKLVNFNAIKNFDDFKASVVLKDEIQLKDTLTRLLILQYIELIDYNSFIETQSLDVKKLNMFTEFDCAKYAKIFARLFKSESDGLIMLGIRGLERMLYSILPTKQTELLKKTENAEKKAIELEYKLKESSKEIEGKLKESLEKLEEKSKKSSIEIGAIISLIISIIPLLITNISFIGQSASIGTILIINSVILFAISAIFAFVSIILLKETFKKWWVILIVLGIAVVLLVLGIIFQFHVHYHWR